LEWKRLIIINVLKVIIVTRRKRQYNEYGMSYDSRIGSDLISNDIFLGLALADTLSFVKSHPLELRGPFSLASVFLTVAGHLSNGDWRSALCYWHEKRGEFNRIGIPFPVKGRKPSLLTAMQEVKPHLPFKNVVAGDIVTALYETGTIDHVVQQFRNLGYLNGFKPPQDSYGLLQRFQENIDDIVNFVIQMIEDPKPRPIIGQHGVLGGIKYFEELDPIIDDPGSFVQWFGFATGIMDTYDPFRYNASQSFSQLSLGGGICAPGNRKAITESGFDLQLLATTQLMKEKGKYDENDPEQVLEFFKGAYLDWLVQNGVVYKLPHWVAHKEEVVPIYVRQMEGPGTSDYMSNVNAFFHGGWSGFFGNFFGDYIDTAGKATSKLYFGDTDGNIFNLLWARYPKFRDVMQEIMEHADNHIFFISENNRGFPPSVSQSYFVREIQGTTALQHLIMFLEGIEDYMRNPDLLSELPEIPIGYERVSSRDLDKYVIERIKMFKKISPSWLFH